MNKKQVKKIKDAMSYADTPQQKRVLRQIKKQYIEIPSTEKSKFITEVEDFFKKGGDK
jgi:hypothetical protein